MDGNLVGLAGQVMLALGAAIMVGGLVALVPRLLRVRRRAAAFQRTVRALQYEVTSATDLLTAQRAEMYAQLAPWRRVRRWLRHPLTVAALEWYGRRRHSRRRARKKRGE